MKCNSEIVSFRKMGQPLMVIVLNLGQRSSVTIDIEIEYGQRSSVTIDI